jgi:N-acetylmuramoyl-L-alanine amidase
MGISVGGAAGNAGGDAALLARLISAEARGEPYSGQVAVGAVVLNRVKSSSFPNSVSGVIFQRGAFSAVDDGQINLTPNDSALKAAKDAMNGWDPTGGCLYYYNPDKTSNRWIRSRPVVLRIGRHVFCK